jgi:hypothetical protein
MYINFVYSGRDRPVYAPMGPQFITGLLKAERHKVVARDLEQCQLIGNQLASFWQ